MAVSGIVSFPSLAMPETFKISSWGEIMFLKFGEYKDCDVVDVPSYYLKWLLDQGWFLDNPSNTRLIKEIEGEMKHRTKTGIHFNERGGRKG